jgi:hypothetical protein
LIDPTRASGGGSSLTTSGIYVYNSSTTIYFNETKLNSTIYNGINTTFIYLGNNVIYTNSSGSLIINMTGCIGVGC